MTSDKRHRRQNTAIRRTALILAIAGIGLSLSGCPMGSDPIDDPDVTESFFPPNQNAAPKVGIVTGRYYYEMAENPRRFFDDWYQLGLHWIRIEFEEFWDHRPDGGYVTSYDDPTVTEKQAVYETIIDAAHERHIKVLGVIGVNAMPGQLYFEDDGSVTQNALDRYTTAVQWHLDTYDIDAIEIWNEPWGYGFGSASGNTKLLKGYGHLLVETYTSCKSSAPDVQFVAPVTANAEQGEWLGHHGWGTTYRFAPEESLFNNSYVQDYRDNNNDDLPLDVISWHPYGTGGDPAGSFYYGRTFAQYFETITGERTMYVDGANMSGLPANQVSFTDVAGRSIVGDYPVWFTEWGWNTNSTAESLQAEYITHMFQAMDQFPQIEVAMLYTYKDDEDTADSEGKAYGIIRNSEEDYARKPAYFELMGHATGVGLTSDGTILREFVDAYVAGGGKADLGLPTAPVQTATDGTQYQQLTGGSQGPVQLVESAGGSVSVE